LRVRWRVCDRVCVPRRRRARQAELVVRDGADGLRDRQAAREGGGGGAGAGALDDAAADAAEGKDAGAGATAATAAASGAGATALG